MKRKTAKRDIYQEVTDRIVAALDAGVVPWRCQWSRGAGLGMPSNFRTGKAYRGINTFLLSVTALSAGYSRNQWVTFNQAKDLGGSVRKGEKGTAIIFWKFYDKKTGEQNDDGSDKTERLPVLRHYVVFNVEQCDGLNLPALPEIETHENDPIETCDEIVAGFDGPEIVHGGDRACYNRVDDVVKMPERERFENSAAYYSTTFHELTHSTGHQSRLNRATLNGVAAFGDDCYSHEELIAEMGAAFLCGAAGILDQTIEANAAYLDGWRKKISADKTLVVKAAGQAQKAADMILGTTFDDDDE